MATQYTPILKLALPVTGELSGTWGDTVNDNITSMVEQAVAGLATINTWTANVHTLTTANGTTSESRCAMLVAADGAGGTALTAAGEIICPAASKLYVLKNSTSYAITLKTAAGTGVAVPAGQTAFLFCDGTNVNACVTTIVNGNVSGNLSVNGNLTVDGNTTLGNALGDIVTINGTATFVNAAPTLSTLTASQAVFTNGSKQLVSNAITGSGNVVMSASPTLTGTVAGASLTLSSLTSGRVTYAGASGLLQDSANLTFNGTDLTVSGTVNATTIDLTNIEVTNIKAKDGTAAMSLADSTGVVSLTANPVLSGGTANGVAYLNASKVLTTGSALTFDGTKFTQTAGTTGILSEFKNTSSANQNGNIVASNDTGAAVRLQVFGSAAGTFGMVTAGMPLLYTIAADLNIVADNASGAIKFGLSGAAEQMRLTSTGLLIGTSSPTYGGQLTVRGTTQTVASFMNSNFVAATSGTQLNINAGATTGNTNFQMQVTSGGGLAFNDLILQPSGGNLGLGVTPSAWSGWKALQISGRSSFFGNDTETFVGNNFFYDGADGRYIATATAALYRQSTGAHAWLTAPSGTAGNAISFTQAMTLDASGNLGVGETSPSVKLEVAGNAKLTGSFPTLTIASSDNLSILAMTNSGGATKAGSIITDNNGTMYFRDAVFYWETYDGATRRLTLDASGNLGLGVTPSAWYSSGITPAIQVANTGAYFAAGSNGYSSSQWAWLGNNGYFNSSSQWIYTRSQPAAQYRQLNNEHAWFNAPSGNAGDPITFTQAMTLDASGNLGIGTSSPAQKLHVSGASGSVFAQVTSGSNQMYMGYANGIGSTIQSNNLLAFYTGASYTQNMVLDSSGNLGLGVTPSASSLQTIEAQVGLFVGRAEVDITSNAYYNGGWKYVSSGLAPTQYQANGGLHKWFNAPSGTAGNAITFTQAMTLDASGNLALGTTSALSGASGRTDLTINGSSNAILSFGVGGVRKSYLYYDTDLTLANETANPIRFMTNGTERARITSGGDFLVNATSVTGNVNAGSKLIAVAGTNDNPPEFKAGGTNAEISISGGSEASYLWSKGAYPLVIATNNAERARIDSSGNFVVARGTGGDTTVGSTLYADGTVTTARASSNNGDLNLYVYSTGAAAARFYVGMGGTVYATSTTITAISDQRLKENIQDIDVGLSAIMALKPRKFDWKAGKGKDKKGDRGWIAQEFEQVFPDMVDTWADPAPEGEEPYKAVNADLIPVLVKAIQEQQALITALTARVAALEAK